MEALHKFMEAFNMTYSVEYDRDYYFGGHKSCCVKTEVKRDGNLEYLKYSCYSLKSNGDTRYEEGNEIKGIQDGVLTYLGMDRQIDNYFSQKAAQVAKNYLDKTYPN